MRQYTIAAFAAGIFICIFSSGLHAGQKSTVSISADVTAGGNGPNVAGNDLSQSPKRFVSFYGSYPSIALRTQGQHSAFQMSYGYGYNRNNSNPQVTARSHSASLRFANEAGGKWSVDFSDGFDWTADISSFNLFQGNTTIPEEFRFIFNPVVTRSSRSNTASLGIGHTVSERSTLTFNVSHSLRMYGDVSQFKGLLSDQQRYSASMTFSHKLQHGSWGVGYNGAQFNFDLFSNARSHSVNLTYSHQFDRGITLSLAGGPSYVETPEAVKHRIGSNSSLGLQKAIRKGSFSFTLAQNQGDSSGFGSVTNNLQVALGMTHLLGRKTTLSMDISGFDTRSKTATSYKNRGISGGATLGFAIARMWSLNWGGQYQHYDGSSQFTFDQKRIFATLRFHNPELWRF